MTRGDVRKIVERRIAFLHTKLQTMPTDAPGRGYAVEERAALNWLRFRLFDVPETEGNYIHDSR